MSSITIDHDELIGKRNKHQRYKEILDAQIREKHVENLFRKRNHTTIDRSSPSFSFKNNEAHPGERRLIQQSTFLPTLAEKGSSVRKGHERSYTYGYGDNNDTNNFETDAMDYLRDCESILENLKRLTKNSTKKIENTIILDKIHNGQIIRSNLRVEKQASFFRSPEIDESLVLKSNRFIKKEANTKDNHHSDHDENHQIGSSRIKTYSIKSSEELKESFKMKGKTDSNLFVNDNCNNEEEMKGFHEEKSVQTKITFKDDQNEISSTTTFVSKDKHFLNEFFETNSHTEKVNIKQCSAFCGSEVQKGSDKQHKEIEVEEENKTIERSGFSPQERKQKFLVKFLNQANTRGIELHKRIMEHKLKNKGSIHSISNLCGKSKELKQNIEKEQNNNSIFLNKKELEEKKSMEHLDATKSTERERKIASNTEAFKFSEKVFENNTENKKHVETPKNKENEKEKIKIEDANAVIMLSNPKNKVKGSKAYCETSKQNEQEASDDEESDSKYEDSDEDEEEKEEELSEELEKENNNNKIVNAQKEPKQFAS